MSRATNTMGLVGGVGVSGGLTIAESGMGIFANVVAASNNVSVSGYTMIDISWIVIAVLAVFIGYIVLRNKEGVALKNGLVLFGLSSILTLVLYFVFLSSTYIPKYTWQYAGVKGEVEGCYKSGTAIRCDFLLSNIKVDASVNLDIKRTTSFAHIGTISKLVPWQIEVGNDIVSHTNNWKTTLVEGSTVNVSLYFKLKRDMNIQSIHTIAFRMYVDGSEDVHEIPDTPIRPGY